MRTVLRHPLQLQILNAAQSPVSAAELARQLGLPRQKLNYHMRQLAAHGFLQPVAQQRKRNMVEQLYVATTVEPARESASVEQLLSLCARAEAELNRVAESAAAAGVRVRTLALQQELRFGSAAERQEFMQVLVEAIAEVVAEFESDGARSSGWPVRLVLGCYPMPAESF